MSTSLAPPRGVRSAVIAALAAVPLFLTACGSDTPSSPASRDAGETGEVGEVDQGVFDSVKREFNVELGDELRVRTEASGSKWLVSKATDFHTPEKVDLAVDDDVWGTEPMPGRLLLLTCLRASAPNESVLHNAVVGYLLDRVEDDDGMDG